MNIDREIRDKLYEYADKHTGEIAKLTYDAGCYIDLLWMMIAELQGRIKELEKEKENMSDDGK